MKKLLVCVLLVSVLFNIKVVAQATIIDDINYTQLEEFIALAKNNYPRRKIMGLNEQKAKSNITRESVSILDMVNASYFYRPDEQKAINPENPYIFNGVQYGVSLSVGTLVAYPFRVKEAKINHQIAIQEGLDYDKSLILEVKNKYYMYILQTKELKLRTQAAQDAQATADDVSLRFERGEVELLEYNAAKANLNAVNSAKIQVEMAYLFAKDQLEEMIGLKLTEIAKKQ